MITVISPNIDVLSIYETSPPRPPITSPKKENAPTQATIDTPIKNFRVFSL
ncbi:hypothetical protein QWZ13_10355 [Reinekea marina]|uniref:hypothetical protein n=1 Tax=Reinekea marina TaxID=1310421 RepID=UPI0025B42E1B|nr:hypothetical protein [Reinekea marina]MDN3649315.1 hypothetical protein [Reinekea marina]